MNLQKEIDIYGRRKEETCELPVVAGAVGGAFGLALVGAGDGRLGLGTFEMVPESWRGDEVCWKVSVVGGQLGGL